MLYRQQGKYNQALSCLQQIEGIIESNDSNLPILYLNFGKVFSEMMKTDSAALYYQLLEESLPTVQLRDETKASAYGTLSQFAKSQGQFLSALQYLEKHERALFSVMQHRQQQSVYQIQKQYDYESLQNIMNQKLARTQRVIAVGIVLLLSVVALFLYHLAKRNKKEAEINVNLFHFMQQNEELKSQVGAMKQDFHLSQQALQQRMLEIYKSGEENKLERILSEFSAVYPQARK